MSNLQEQILQQQNLEDISIIDVNYFLESHNIEIKINPYLTLWDFLLTNKDNILAPESIADWVLTYNIQKRKIRSDFTNEELNMFGLQALNRNRLDRILKYLYIDKLIPNELITNELITNLPNELITKILLFLDCDSIINFCKSSNKIRNICNGEFLPLFREKLCGSTGFNTDNYNFQQLIYLCKQQKYRKFDKIAFNTNKVYFISEGSVYSSGSSGTELTNINEIGLDNIIEIAGGINYVLTLGGGGRVYSFGNNNRGQLGLGDEISRKEPTLIPNLPKIVNIAAEVMFSALLSEDGNVYVFGKGFGEVRREILYPTKVEGFKNIVQIAIGNGHLLALDINGNVYGFGTNDYDQIDKSNVKDYEVPKRLEHLKNIFCVAAGNYGSYAVDINGKLFTNIKNNAVPNFKITKIFTKTLVSSFQKGENDLFVMGDDGYIYNVGKKITKLNIKDIIYVKRGRIDFFVDNNGNLYVKILDYESDSEEAEEGKEGKEEFILKDNITIDV
jgi:hypothetical protein